MTNVEGPTTSTTSPAPTASTLRRGSRRQRVLGALAVLLVVLAGYTIWTNTQPAVLTSSIEIDATPEQVWQILTDFESYPDWNPFMTSATVTMPDGLRVGARMHIHLHDLGGDMDFDPKVLAVDPGHELRWIGKVNPGWIADGEHQFLITQLGPHRVRLAQTEHFTGVAVPFITGSLNHDTLPQFRVMNAAAARLAEALPD